MINEVYQVLQTIVNKEQSGYITPEEFNNIADLVQQEIFRGYFEDINRDENKENRGLSNIGYGNLSANETQRLEVFSEYAELDTEAVEGKDYLTTTLPEDLYYLDDRGMISGNGKVIEEVGKSSFGYVKNSISTFSKLYPVFSKFGTEIRIFPSTIANPVTITYIRKPKSPRWTYRNISGNPLFDPSNSSYRDFELHSSEFANIVLKMLTFFGINLREEVVMQIAEQLKNTITQKDNA